jgi:hypothetical protein
MTEKSLIALLMAVSFMASSGTAAVFAEAANVNAEETAVSEDAAPDVKDTLCLFAFGEKGFEGI